MRFLVVGAGAAGVAIGTGLAADGNDVSFVDLAGEVAALGGKPFVFERADKRIVLDAPAVALSASGLFDYVLLCVRLHELEAALPALRDHLAHDAAVVTLQPGTAAAMRAAEALGAAAVLPASLEATIALAAPGHARVLGDSFAVTIGEAAPTDSWRVEVLDAALNSAGIECRTLPGPAGDPDAEPALIAADAPILEALGAALARDLELVSAAAGSARPRRAVAAEAAAAGARGAPAALSAAALDIATGIRPDIVTAAAGLGDLPPALAAMAALPLPTRRANAKLPSIQVSVKDDCSTLPKGAA